MNYNPKVVPFNRSAAYVHHRAMKNMRNNNPVDALELMRHAVENSPDNWEYRLDLAEMYCEMGCHEQSNRILLDMIAQADAPAECYYGLALNQFGKNEMESARQALLLYQRYAKDDEYMEEVGGLCAEMDYYEAMRRPLDRKQGRAVQMSARACDALKANEPEKACRLFEKSLARKPDQPEMRALYALALRILAREEQALREARASVEAQRVSTRALCVAAQVLWQCGQREDGVREVLRAMRQKPEGAELRLLIFTLSEMSMHAEAADEVRRALWEAPHDKNLLHMRAVALHYMGHSDAQVKSFWLRILRIDPEDSIARYYLEIASAGRLAEIKPCYVYEVPDGEYRRRLNLLADALGEGLENCVVRWKVDARFRQLLVWAVNTGDESSARAAIMVIASAGDACSESILRELFYRSDVPVSVKIHALVFMRLRDGNVNALVPTGANLQDGLLPEPEALLKTMPACERQLVRFAAEVLENAFSMRAGAALAAMWQVYRNACAQDNDPLVCTQEAAAALAWNYLLGQNVKVSVRRLEQIFNCRRRRMVFYARYMATVLEKQGEMQEDDEGH